MRISVVKELTIFFSIVLLLLGKGIGPIAAQEPSGERLPSPTEPTLPPILPIEPETLPEVQPPPLDVDPEIVKPEKIDPETADTEADSECLPLANSGEVRFTATDIEVVGNTVLQNEIAQVVACYEGQNITLSDLFTLRSLITQLYIDDGYVTSGAFIPSGQVIGESTQAAVTIQVVEGRLEDVQINGLSRLREGYVTARIGGTSPLNQQTLRESLQLLQLDPNIQQINAELTAGSQPGQSLLILDLSEPSPFSALIDANNNRSPSIGSAGASISTSYRNLLGIGDTILASYGLTEGLNLYDYSVAFPFNAANGTLNLRYSNSDSRIVEDAFRDVGIRSDTNTASIGIRQPIVQTTSQEFALGLDFDWRRTQSFILDSVPFSFSVGPEEGRSQVSVLRFSQDWTKRDASRVLAARSQFNVGLDIFGATDTGTDGQFFSWIGQFQWVQQVSPRVLSLVKFNAQLTPDSLLPSERFSLGGVSSVRGYAQNQLVADNALNTSVEFRVPVTRNPNVLQVTPFVDAGLGWNNMSANPASNFLLGSGVGLRWQATPNLLLRTDYGIPLVNGDRGGSLQENGFYFSLSYQP